MDKQLGIVAHTIKKAQKSCLSISLILRNALKIAINANGRLAFFITFVMFSLYSLVGLADHLVLRPVLRDLVANFLLVPTKVRITEADPTIYIAIVRDVRFLLNYKFATLSFLCVVFMFSVAASVHSTYEACTDNNAKSLSLKEMLSRVTRLGRWKRPLKTSIWMILISLASAILLLVMFGLIGVMTEGPLFTTMYWILVVLGVVCCVHTCALWMLSLVVSVMEENLSGLKAIHVANSELSKVKKLQGFVLMMLLVLASGAMHQTFSFLEAYANLVGLAISVPRIWSYCLMIHFYFVVYTLFYHECRRSYAKVENARLYAPTIADAEF